MSWRRIVHRTENRLDRIKARLSRRYDRDDPLMVVAYRGYGTAQRLYLKGRVLEDNGISVATPEDSRWRNLVNTYKRFESDEVPGAVIKAKFQGLEQHIVTDEEGYFDLWFTPPQPLPDDTLWHPVELELISPVREGKQPVNTIGTVLAPPPSAKFGIISDVDDTIVHTHATSMISMGRTVFMGNAHTRTAYTNVPAFYHALQKGVSGKENNPIFYVSSSPWNLYDMLDEFLNLRHIPPGPLMLRDWGITNDEVLPTKHGPHKFKAIRQILNTYPELPFILIGDSGQEDTTIYATIAEEYPNRILAIYIRDVSYRPKKANALKNLINTIVAKGLPLVVAKETRDHAHHAVARGWVDESLLAGLD